MKRTIQRFEIHQQELTPLSNNTIESTLKLFDQGKYSEALDGCFKFLHTGDIRILLTLVQIYQYGLGTTLSLSEAEKYLIMAAAKDVTACFQLAEWYDHGIRGEPDHQKAYDYYTKAAQQMYNPAMLKLAGYLNDEKDPQYNPEEAFYIYKSIADDRSEIYPEASYQTGLHYLKGKGVEKNTREAFRYISNAVIHNYAPAIYQLGLMYIDGDGVALNQETAFKLMNQAASLNYPSMLLDGTMVSKDYEKAFLLVSNGASNGDPECMRVLSRIYGEGLGVKEDPLKSAELIKKAAQAGSIKAQRILGLLYMLGRNEHIPRDVEKAIEWYTKSAEQGDQKAQYYLGVFYSDGKKIPTNYPMAQKWLTRLAENGHREAMYNLGYLYANAKLSEKPDYKKARYYYVEAAHLGQIDARFELAKLYHTGVPGQDENGENYFEKDDQLAYYYVYLIPDEYPNREYPALLKEIEAAITPSEKADIQQQARMQMLNQVSQMLNQVSVKIQRNT